MARLLPADNPQIHLTPTRAVSDRQVRPDAFTVTDVAHVRHVLVVDDTWVSGGTAMSGVWTLRDAGIPLVTTLALARWVRGYYTPSRQLSDLVASRHAWRQLQESRACPFTLDGTCPATPARDGQTR
ncbi:hypothetical protein [Actinomyces faecalis]|uniref:hypothetical protein n=1 Tax=Actinomyces faecalis TaxID=2722820 RepID=UPI0015533F9D|nr:hypothetical protein [Actinomyces faecalis]